MVSLVLAVVTVVAARLLLAARSRSIRASRASRSDALLVVLGWLGLSFHCSAMFYRAAVDWIPGVGPLVNAVNAMGVTSAAAFVVPAALSLLGLRRTRPWLIGSVAVALAAVGITMYNGGSLGVHLGAIFCAVVLMALATAELVSDWRAGTPGPA